MAHERPDMSADESEGLYKSLFDLTPLPTVIHDGTVVVRANPAAAEVFGFEDADSLVGVELKAHVHPDSAAGVATRVAALLRGESVPPLVERYLRHDGSAFEGETFASPTTWHGKPAVHVIIRDLTEVREAEAQLERSEESYRQLFEMSPDPIVVHDGQTPLLMNKAAEAFLGLSDAGDTEPSIWAVIPEELRPQIAERLKKLAASGGSSSPVTVPITALDGEVREAEISSAPTWWQGKPAIVTIFRDLTERRRAEAALNEVEQRYAAVVEHAPMGMHVYDLDPDDRVVFTAANNAADEILGTDSTPMLGLTFEEAWAPWGIEAALGQRIRAVARDGVADATSVVVGEGAERRVIDAHAFQVGPHTAVVMFEDVTVRSNNEEELDRYRHRLEELVAQRTRALDQAHRDVEAITAVAARAVELRDPYTAGHQRRVAQLAQTVALEMGLGEEAADHIRIAGKLHDIGKLSIPAEILSKPGRLLSAEYELVKAHSQAASDILSSVDIGWPLERMIVQHHERMDGSGYPAGLSGEDIVPEARILAVADVVEAMSSHRPYRPALGIEAALSEIMTNRGTLYDADVVDACVAVLEGGFVFEES